MPDLTSTITPAPAQWYQHAGTNHCAYVLDLVADGMNTLDTFDFATLNIGDAILDATILVEEDVVGAVSLILNVNGVAVTGTILVAELTAGDQINVDLKDALATTSAATYAQSAASTVSITTGGVATAGKIVVLLNVFSTKGLFDQVV